MFVIEKVDQRPSADHMICLRLSEFVFGMLPTVDVCCGSGNCEMHTCLDDDSQLPVSMARSKLGQSLRLVLAGTHARLDLELSRVLPNANLVDSS